MTPKPRVLLVDDSAEIRAVLRRELRMRGYEVVEAEGGAQALALFAVVDVDAVIADFEMPGMDGLELLQRLRLLRPNLVRILLTGRADVTVAARALNEGAADRFFLKPWDRVDLMSILEMLTRTWPLPPA